MKPKSSQLPHTDNAFFGPLRGGAQEPTYGGALSFMRRRYSRDLAGVDVAVWGIPLDAAVSNRPGARFGPQAIRRASAIFDGDPQYPFGRDPFEELTVVDYGDCAFDYGAPRGDPRCDRGPGARRSSTAGVHLVSLGGDHFVTWPLLAGARRAARPAGAGAVRRASGHLGRRRRPARPRHASSAARCGRGLIDPARSIQVGIRTHAPDDCGHRDHRRAMRSTSWASRGVIERDPAPGRRRPGLSDGRHRLPRPGLRPGHRHAGRRRPELGAGADVLRGLGGLDWRGMDVVEVAPAYDHADITAIAAATVVQRHIGALAMKRRKQDWIDLDSSRCSATKSPLRHCRLSTLPAGRAEEGCAWTFAGLPREQGTERDRSSRDPIADAEEEALGPAGVPWKTAARIATVGIFFLMFCVILALAQTILLPVVSAFVIGTMLGPLTRLGDRLRMPQWLSATLVMAAFVGFLALSVTLLSAPIVEWIERAPGYRQYHPGKASGVRPSAGGVE